MNLIVHLEQRAHLQPDQIALADSKNQLTYRELYQRVCSGSKQLRRDGLISGNCVLLLLPVSTQLYVALLSVLHAGMTVVLLDPSRDTESIKQSLRSVKVYACIGTVKAQSLRLLNSEIRSIPYHYCPSKWVPNTRFWNPCDITSEAPVFTPSEHPALITFTSGSTGIPKTASRTHGFLLAQHAALSESLNYIEGEVDLITLPVFAISNLASGLTSIIADTDLRTPGSVSGNAVLAQCKMWKVSRCAASPAFFQSLLESGQLPSFEAIYTGGAPVYPKLLDQLQTKLPQTKIITVFGSTEAEPIAHNVWNSTTEQEKSEMANGRGLLVGKPVSATTLRVITDHRNNSIPPLSSSEFKAMAKPIGSVGEVVVTGDHVLKGYLNGIGDEETKFSVENTIWHRTGDAAWIDVQGQIWLMGRCKAAIQAESGELIYPFGIECCAMHTSGITRCALMNHRGKITLCYQGELSGKQEANLLSTLKPHSVQKLLSLNLIPMDKRHNAKIDYPALKKELLEH